MEYGQESAGQTSKGNVQVDDNEGEKKDVEKALYVMVASLKRFLL